MIKLGTSDMAKAYIGSSEVSKMYLGSELVWENTPVSILPDGYIQLQWIKNTSDARIDTGITGNGSTTFSLRVRIDELTSSTSNFFGSRYSTTQNALGLSVTSSGSLRFGYSRSTTDVSTITTGTWYDIRWENRKLYLNGTQINNRNSASFTTPFNLLLFGLLGYSSSQKTYYTAKCSMGICSIDNLIFVPCINPNNVVGMYEKTNGVFISSDNNTAFVAGDTV